MERYKEALSQIFRKDPDDYRVRATLKKLYIITHDLEGFVALLQEVINDHPQNVRLLGTLKGLKKQVYGGGPDNA